MNKNHRITTIKGKFVRKGEKRVLVVAGRKFTTSSLFKSKMPGIEKIQTFKKTRARDISEKHILKN